MIPTNLSLNKTLNEMKKLILCTKIVLFNAIMLEYKKECIKVFTQKNAFLAQL